MECSFNRISPCDTKIQKREIRETTRKIIADTKASVMLREVMETTCSRLSNENNINKKEQNQDQLTTMSIELEYNIEGDKYYFLEQIN